MDGKQKQILRQIKTEVSEIFERDFSGHDMKHTLRVYENAMCNAKAEKADLFLVGLTALLHDVDDFEYFL